MQLIAVNSVIRILIDILLCYAQLIMDIRMHVHVFSL